MGPYDLTIGTLLVGVFFNTYLYGLVTYQFVTYYRAEFNDRPVIKCMVLFLFFLDTFYSISVIYMMWYYTVTNYDNPAALAAVWPYICTPVATALGALVTQAYLGFRIWRFTKSDILYGVITLLAITSFILGVTCSIKAWTIKVLSGLSRITSVKIAWLSTQVVVNALITTTLIIIIFRSRTDLHRMDTTISQLTRGAIQTGLFAGIFSLGGLIAFIILPHTNFPGMFAIPIGRIYTNTLLDTLLTRGSLRAELAGAYKVNGVASPFDCVPTGSVQHTLTGQPTSIQLKVQKTVEERYDPSASEDAEGRIVPLVSRGDT